MSFDLIKLATRKPIDVITCNAETVAFYQGVIQSVTDEKLAVDYLEVVRYSETLTPNETPHWLKRLSNMIFHEAQRRGIIDEIEDLI